MPRASRTAPGPRLAGAAAALLTLAACDNPACVFDTGNCQEDEIGGTPGALGGEPATLPANGAWISNGAPALQEASPSGAGVHSGSPVVLVFNESLAAESVPGAFRIEALLDFGPAPVGATAALLVADRVVVLLPATPLQAGVPHQVVYDAPDDAPLRDLTGQVFDDPGSPVLEFTVATDDPDEVELLLAWPRNNTTNQANATEIALVFDRPIEASSFTPGAFDVTANGADPAVDPLPVPLQPGGFFLPPDTRVWRWLPQSSDGSLASFDPSSDVEVALSPTGSELADADGNTLPATTIEFETAPFAAPSLVTLTSLPSDAIGIENLDEDGTNDLAVQVDLVGALAGDRVDLFLFGTGLDGGELAALQRNLTLTTTDAGAQTVTWSAAQVDLTTSTAPVVGRFADDPVAFAFRPSRNGVIGPVTVLDVDDAVTDIQDPLLDTTPPTLVDLQFPGGGGDLYRSALRDLALTGQASEALREVEVHADPGGPLDALTPDPPVVVGSDEDGRFVSAAAPIGALDPLAAPVPYELVLRDAALNESEPIAGLYTQVGAVRGAPLVADATIAVEVFDARTLAPLPGALVLTHADDGATYPFVASDTTDAAGLALVDAHPASASGTLLTVDLAGYDLFTFHGVPTDTLSIPLRASGTAPASALGTLSSGSSFVATALQGSDVALADSRRAPELGPTFASGACVPDPTTGGTSCSFGPQFVAPSRYGAESAFVGDFLLSQGSFGAGSLVTGFDLAVPVPDAAPGGATNASLVIDRLFGEPGVPADEKPTTVGNVSLSTAFATNLGPLVDDPAFTGAPRVVLQARFPGLERPATVGLGLAFDQGGGSYTVGTSLPGEARALADAIAPTGGAGDDLLLAFGELVDTAGNRSFARPSLTQLFSSVPSGFGGGLFPGRVPSLLAPDPTTGGSGSAAGYDLEFTDSLQAVGPEGTGLYRVQLLDSTGRGWELYRVDPGNGAAIVVRVPDVAAGGGTPLADGDVAATVTGVAWPGFDATAFLWTDLLREPVLGATTAPVVFQQR